MYFGVLRNIKGGKEKRQNIIGHLRHHFDLVIKGVLGPTKMLMSRLDV